MKWVLLAIVASSPIENGMAYDSHVECQSAAQAFVVDYIEVKQSFTNPWHLPESPKYACLPKAPLATKDKG